MKATALLMMLGAALVYPALSEALESSGAKYTLSLSHDYVASEWTHEMGYPARAKDKLLFGGKNTLLGFMELDNEPRDAAREDASIMRAMGRRTVNMLGDTLGGAVHVITFPITAVDVPLPEGGTDIL